MAALRQWSNEKLQQALLLSADQGMTAAAAKLGIARQSLANAFNRYGLSVREAKQALNDNQPSTITLGKGPFPIKAWPIHLTDWCSSAARLETQPNGCRWLTGDPLAEHSYCCKPVVTGKKLCSGHLKKSFLR